MSEMCDSIGDILSVNCRSLMVKSVEKAQVLIRHPSLGFVTKQNEASLPTGYTQVSAWSFARISEGMNSFTDLHLLAIARPWERMLVRPTLTTPTRFHSVT